MNKQLPWFEALQLCKHRGDAFVMATVLSAGGSTPRDQDAKMVITQDQQFDTIGGGRLEFEVINLARNALNKGEAGYRIEKFALGSQLGQCCGGSVSVLLESFTATQFQVAVFGAGHVAHALIPILGGLPCQVHWIDQRAELFPEQRPPNVKLLPAQDPAAWVAKLPAGTDLVIMTHNHDLDFAITAAALQRPELRSIGLIGSRTKARRFQHRLSQLGFSVADLERVICPIGLSDVPGKLPMEVAVSIAGQLIAREHQDHPKPAWRGMGKKDIKELLHSGPETVHNDE
ncbi:MAG: xanthine dehydrogenase accessory protein XdhC [Natronospirillum sp.]